MKDFYIPGRGISSPPGEMVLLPYMTVRFCEVAMGKPGPVSAVAMPASSAAAPALTRVLLNMFVLVMSIRCVIK